MAVVTIDGALLLGAVHSGGGSDWALVLGAIGTVLALGGLGWNVYNVVSDRRIRRTPDVHGIVMRSSTEPSRIAFVNAGQGVARSVQYFYRDENRGVIGGHGFLLPEHAEEHVLDFSADALRSTMVWAYMDVQGRVYAKSNDGQSRTHPRGAIVSLRKTFEEMYPEVKLPPGRDQMVGE